MSLVNDSDGEELQVGDEEDYTDKKTKQRLLNTRELLNEAQHELFSARLVEPDVEYSEVQALMAWGDLVTSYIRDLSVLLNNDDVPEAKFYREDVDLGSITLIPQDTERIPFSKIQYEQFDEDYLLRQFPGFDRNAELPKPVEIPFNGLMSLVERDNYVEKHWIVTKNPRQAGPNQKTVETMDRQPIPRHIYARALMAADEFLQGVGIGLDLSEDGVPEFGFEEVHEDE